MNEPVFSSASAMMLYLIVHKDSTNNSPQKHKSWGYRQKERKKERSTNRAHGVFL